MTNPADAEYTTHPRHHIMRSYTLWFINNQDAVHHITFLIRKILCLAPRISVSTKHPLARLWPPPLKRHASKATSTFTCDRRFTRVLFGLSSVKIKTTSAPFIVFKKPNILSLKSKSCENFATVHTKFDTNNLPAKQRIKMEMTLINIFKSLPEQTHTILDTTQKQKIEILTIH